MHLTIALILTAMYYIILMFVDYKKRKETDRQKVAATVLGQTQISDVETDVPVAENTGATESEESGSAFFGATNFLKEELPASNEITPEVELPELPKSLEDEKIVSKDIEKDKPLEVVVKQNDKPAVKTVSNEIAPEAESPELPESLEDEKIISEDIEKNKPSEVVVKQNDKPAVNTASNENTLLSIEQENAPNQTESSMTTDELTNELEVLDLENESIQISKLTKEELFAPAENPIPVDSTAEADLLELVGDIQT